MDARARGTSASATPWHPRSLRVVKGRAARFPDTCAPSVGAADGKAWRWEGDRTGRGPAKLVFGVASEAARVEGRGEKGGETPRRKEAKDRPFTRSQLAHISTSPAEAKHRGEGSAAVRHKATKKNLMIPSSYLPGRIYTVSAAPATRPASRRQRAAASRARSFVTSIVVTKVDVDRLSVGAPAASRAPMSVIQGFRSRPAIAAWLTISNMKGDGS